MPKVQVDPGQFKLVVPMEIRFRDTDAMGHVNNAVYLSFMELARVHYAHQVLGNKEIKDIRFIIAHIEIDYLFPVTLKDAKVHVGIKASGMRGASFDFEYAIWAGPDKKLAALSKSTQVMYDYKAGRAERISQEARDKISGFEGVT